MKKIFIVALLPFLFSFSTYAKSENKNTKTSSAESVDESKITSPDEALAALTEGNQRFVSKKALKQDFNEQVQNTKSDQHPFAAVISCLDSRVPPEIVFDQGFGDIFVGRVAGNVVNPDLLGSLEFATKVKGSKLIMVLGHTSCGAVAGACGDVKLGSLTQLLDKIKPSVDKVKSTNKKFDPKSMKNVDEVAIANVQFQADRITKESSIIADLVKEGKVKVVGAMYNLETGKVSVIPTTTGKQASR